MDIQILAHDGGLTAYWSGGFYGATLTDQQTTQVAAVQMASVGTVGTFTLNASAPGAPPSTLPPQIDLWLDPPNTKFPFNLAQLQTTTLSMSSPSILGATLNATVTLQEKGSTSTAWSYYYAKAMPLTGVANLTVPPLPALASPQGGGSVSASSGAIAWTDASKNLVYFADFSITTNDAGGSEDELYVLTSDVSVDLARLSHLGAGLALGRSSVFVAGLGNVASLDAIVDQDVLASPDGTTNVAIDWAYSVTP